MISSCCFSCYIIWYMMILLYKHIKRSDIMNVIWWYQITATALDHKLIKWYHLNWQVVWTDITKELVWYQVAVFHVISFDIWWYYSISILKGVISWMSFDDIKSLLQALVINLLSGIIWTDKWFGLISQKSGMISSCCFSCYIIWYMIILLYKHIKRIDIMNVIWWYQMIAQRPTYFHVHDII